MNRPAVRLLIVGTLLLVSVTACGSAGPPTAPAADQTTSFAGLVGGAALMRAGCSAVTGEPAMAPPTGTTDSAPVLTVTGTAATGVPAARYLRMSDLDSMPQIECSVDDRLAEGHQVLFRGVLLSAALASVGAEPSTTLHISALNDYAVDIPVSDITTLPVLLATSADGAAMSVSHYGPLRIIYPTTGFDLDPTIYDPRRIWQLSSIDVA